METKQAEHLPMIKPEMTEFIDKVHAAIKPFQDNVIPAEVAIEAAVEAVLKVIDGSMDEPGYLVIPRNPDRLDELQEATSISGHLHVLFTEINS